jgi:GNAT superfamily N-acetyltransferase
VPTFVRVPPDHPDAVRLSLALRLEMAERYGDDADSIEPTDPDAAWLIVVDDDGTAIGSGAVQPLRASKPGSPDDHGEVKRVYLVPSARGRGLARPLMRELVALAGELGYTWLQLETGDEQPEAIGLYTRSGWTPVPNYGQYADDPRSHCFGLAVPAC